MKLYIILLCYFTAIFTFAQSKPYLGSGTVSFISEAPLEVIKATSSDLKGIIDLKAGTFAFTFPVNTFQGFNSPLQKEHFNEYYLETAKFPKSTFTGKFIGLKDCSDSCKKTLFAKGKLNIHGVSKIVTIPLSFEKNDLSISINANFETALRDYGISIPKILEAKIATIIKVEVTATFNQQNE